MHVTIYADHVRVTGPRPVPEGQTLPCGYCRNGARGPRWWLGTAYLCSDCLTVHGYARRTDLEAQLYLERTTEDAIAAEPSDVPPLELGGVSWGTAA